MLNFLFGPLSDRDALRAELAAAKAENGALNGAIKVLQDKIRENEKQIWEASISALKARADAKRVAMDLYNAQGVVEDCYPRGNSFLSNISVEGEPSEQTSTVKVAVSVPTLSFPASEFPPKGTPVTYYECMVESMFTESLQRLTSEIAKQLKEAVDGE